MAINHWPLRERPREKLLQQGATSLSDAELLAIFLRTGLAGHSALDLARNLLTAFGSVRGVLEATLEEFCAQPGMGSSRYVQLQAALELTQRHMLEGLQRTDCLNSSVLTRNYLKGRLRSYAREVFLCLFLDNQNRVIAVEELFQGTIDGATVHPRIVVDRALYHNAAASSSPTTIPRGWPSPARPMWVSPAGSRMPSV